MDGKEKNGDENPGEEMVAKGIRFSLTTDKGLLEGVEIYDYDKRGRAFCVISYLQELYVELLKQSLRNLWLGGILSCGRF